MPCPVGALPHPRILYIKSVFIFPGPIFIVEDGKDGEGGDDKIGSWRGMGGIGFGLLVG
jgi:hypothetical protein